jgi:uncharacterized protein YndB with AHSA1/START domain
MTEHDYTTTFTVDRSPREVFEAINDVAGWWVAGRVEGETDRPGAAFVYTNGEIHRSRQEIAELVPDSKVVWDITEGYLNFVEEKDEWAGTRIVFEISEVEDGAELRFTHIGLTPGQECHDVCSNAWGVLIGGNLRRRILTGEPQPDAFARMT